MKRRSRELSSQMAANILKKERAEKKSFFKTHIKKLKPSSFNNIP